MENVVVLQDPNEDTSFPKWILVSMSVFLQPLSTAQGRHRAGEKLDLRGLSFTREGSTMKLQRGKGD